MSRPRNPSRPSILFATVAALLVATLGVCESVGAPVIDDAWIPSPGEEVVFTTDGGETTWRVVAREPRVGRDAALVLERDGEVLHASRSDIRRPGPLLGF